MHLAQRRARSCIPSLLLAEGENVLGFAAFLLPTHQKYGTWKQFRKSDVRCYGTRYAKTHGYLSNDIRS